MIFAAGDANAEYSTQNIPKKKKTSHSHMVHSCRIKKNFCILMSNILSNLYAKSCWLLGSPHSHSVQLESTRRSQRYTTAAHIVWLFLVAGASSLVQWQCNFGGNAICLADLRV